MAERLPSTLAAALLAAIDDGLEVRIYRAPIPAPGEPAALTVTTQRDLGSGSRLASSTIVSREHLTLGAGEVAIAVAIEHATWAIRNAPTDNLEEPRR